MNGMKKALAIILTLAMVLTLIPGTTKVTNVKAADNFIITSPTDKELLAAGYIDIEWTNATSSTVQEYQVYIDDQMVGTTRDTSYEYYTTKVKTFTVYVKARFTDNTTSNTNKIRFAITKKGLGLATDMGANLSLKDMGCAWYYNWGTGPSSGAQYQDVEYVPMVWKETNADNFRNRVEAFKNQGYKYVLTFNEPDLGGQCDMPMEDVYNVWQGIEGMEGINISSPVTALWPSASPDWFQSFMTKVDQNGDYKPDFISIHCYPDNWAGKGMAEWFLTEVVDWTWNTYHLPIWITEFSTTGQYVTATGDNGTKEFWETVMPGLDAREYVERYAAFGFNSETTGLWLYNTGALTPAGQVYKTYGNPGAFTEVEQPTENQTQQSTQAPTTQPSVSGFSYTTSTRDSLLDNTININGTTYKDYINESGVSATATTGNAASAIDNDFGSRWESTHGVDPQSLIVDLGTNRSLKQFSIIWETASAADYTVQISTNGSDYTTVASVTGGASKQNRLDTITLDSVKEARYIKINGTKRSTGYGYSIFDMAVYGVSNGTTETPTEAPTTQAPVVNSGDNIAKGKTAISSANEGDNVAAKYAVDGNDGTRWSSNFDDNAWIYVDLAGTYSVNKVILNWEGAYGKDYDIQTSIDGNNWQTVKSVTGENGGEDIIEFNAVNARYVRMQGKVRGTGYGYSLWEMEVYAGSGSANDSGNTNDNTGNTDGTVSSDVNVALNKTAYQSGSESDGTLAKNAVDGNKSSRWSSNFADDAWMYVDLGSTYSVNKVVLTWEGAYGKDYDIQTSTDGSNWTTVNSIRGEDGGEDVITFNAVNARYVRMQGVTRALPYGYSLWEMEVYTVGTTTDDNTDNNTSGGTNSGNVASGVEVAQGKVAYSSSNEADGMNASKTVDGDSSSRWASSWSDNEWMYVDLGATYSINEVYIKWEGAYGKAYDIQVSNDGTNWTTVKSLTNQDGGEDTITFNATSARYVKMQGVERATGYGYSIWDFKVFAE